VLKEFSKDNGCFVSRASGCQQQLVLYDGHASGMQPEPIVLEGSKVERKCRGAATEVFESEP
jgi:hypothetical protein